MSANETGLDLIAAERQRQVSAEGFTQAHDQHHHRNAELAWAAACYAAPGTIYRKHDRQGSVVFAEPWPREWTPNVNRGIPGYKPWHRPDADRLRQLAKAGALIAAEMDRLLATPSATGRAGDTA